LVPVLLITMVKKYFLCILCCISFGGETKRYRVLARTMDRLKLALHWIVSVIQHSLGTRDRKPPHNTTRQRP
jgi:hypothetical protein